MVHPLHFNFQPRWRRDDQVVWSAVALRWTRLWPGVVGVELVSMSKPWDSKAKTRVAAMERSWTTNSPDSTHSCQ